MTLLLRACLACVFSLAWLGCGAAWASAPQPWSALGHTAFRNHPEPALAGAMTLVQDREGFVWLGTQMGLIRWDGQRVRRHAADPARADALPDNYVMSLHIAANGDLWAGTSSAGLVRYDPMRDSFLRVSGLQDVRVSALADDGAGGLWVGTGAGLERVLANGTVHSAASGAPQISTTVLAYGGVERLLRDHHGGLWIGTRKGLWYRGTDKAPLRQLTLPGTDKTGPAITAITEDDAGRIWIGTRVHGAYLFKPGAAVPVQVLESARPLDGERVLSIVEKSSNVMWLGMEGGGILELDVTKGTTQRFRHRPDITDTLRDDDPQAMLRTRDGQLFVATVDALSQHDPRPQGVVTVRTIPGVDKLSVPALLVRPNGQVWMGLSSGAIARIDPVAGKLGEIGIAQHVAGAGLPRGSVLSLANGPDNTVFIGTQRGLYAADGDGQGLRRILIPQRAPDASVWALALHGDVLWVGGLDGVWAITGTGRQTPQLLRHEDSALGDRRVSAILPMANGDVWVGTRAGLARLMASSPAVEVLPTSAVDQTRLPGGYVTSLVPDMRGRLWVSNFSSGVAVLDRTDGQGRRWFRRFGTAEGLPENGVNVMVDDGAGALWISTDSSLARIDTASFVIEPIGSAEGASISAYWSGAGTRDGRGHLLFGGLNGVSVARPAQLHINRNPPPLVATHIRLGGRTLSASALNRRTQPQLPLVVLPAERERGLSVEFAALDFGLASTRRYAYKLNGFDRDWIDTEATGPRANYTNLPPGDYTLRMRATLADGSAAAIADFPVQVKPAWHERRMVKVLEALLAIAAIGLVMRARTSFLRKRQLELETLIEARTGELRASQARLETMAYADALTGLPNRRLFNDELKRMVAQSERDGEPFGLLLIDLDKFKAVNDTLGHDAGDALLVAAGQRLRHAIRATDKVARLGGDEFAVLLAPRVEVGAMAEVCERIVTAMAQPVVFKEHHLQISASVGAVIFSAHNSNAELLYKQADIALYQTKQKGRNGWTIAPSGSDHEAHASSEGFVV